MGGAALTASHALGEGDGRRCPRDCGQEAVARARKSAGNASYANIAAAVGQPGAVRAVGTANGSNPVCVLVPCHRVIRSDGTLGGYGGGIENKKKLLAAEGIFERAPGLPLVE